MNEDFVWGFFLLQRKEIFKNEIVYFRNMFFSSTLSNVNVIRPLPRFYTLRFGRRTVFNDEEEKIVDYKIKEVVERLFYD